MMRRDATPTKKNRTSNASKIDTRVERKQEEEEESKRGSRNSKKVLEVGQQPVRYGAGDTGPSDMLGKIV